MSMDFLKIDHTKLSEIIDRRRHELGLTLNDLAMRSGLSARTLQYAIRDSRRLRPQTLFELLHALEFSEAEIPVVTEIENRPAGKHIFISYSHRDSEFLDRLMVHLKPLHRQGLIDPWVDTRLLAGDKWKKEIEKALRQARVAVLLVSADFLASDFIVENELPPLLQAAKEKGTLIIPVILKPCRFTREKVLREFQSINPPDEPLSLVDENERELVYDTVAQRIEDALSK